MNKRHYVYRITNTKLNKHYYGTRTTGISPRKDLGIKYFSSSSDTQFREDQKNNPQHYKYTIVSEFDSREAAMRLEIKLHDKFDVGINESFYNIVKQTSTGFDNSGNKHSQEHKDFMRDITSKRQCGETNSFYGKKHTEEWKQHQRSIKLGKKLQIVECPHCKKTGGIAAMKQHHFDNCGKNHWVKKRSEIVECPHCKKTGGAAGMWGHHFDNCKMKLS